VPLPAAVAGDQLADGANEIVGPRATKGMEESVEESVMGYLPLKLPTLA